MGAVRKTCSVLAQFNTIFNKECVMKKMVSLLIMTLCLFFHGAMASLDTNSSAYLFSFKDINGKKINLSDYEDKVIQVVNTASQCGYTPQYARLESLYRAYKDRGLEIIGVPSPDFGNQEFDDNAKIRSFTHDKYGVTFKMMSPNHVTGMNAHPFYIWANQQVGPDGAPKWNFHKYLINKRGQIVAWFPSATSPDASDVKRAIEKNLSA